MRRPLIGASLVFAAVAALALQTSIVVRTGFTMGDFRAFYCAARVASHGADPYHTEPLRSCETGIGSTPFFEKNPGVTIPAPLPGYVIAALVPLSLLPFAAAATIWAALLLAAFLACIVALARFARVSWEVALAVFALSLGVVSLPLGEVVPVALACVCLAAYFAWRGRAGAAALCAAGAMIEPHLGLPVCLGLAVWMPKSRAALALAFVALAALSLAVGPRGNVEYFTSVLPAHALSEIGRDTQYSLTAVLAGAGLAPAAALRAGSLWYAAMVAAGVLLAGALARKTRNRAFLACVPPAFAVFGGTFIHITQIAAALPAAVLLVAYAPRAYRALAVAALLALAVPWAWAYSPALMVAPLVPVAYLAWSYYGGNVRAILLAGIAAALLVFGLSSLVAAAPHGAAHVAAPAIDANLAEASWSAFTQKSSTNGFATWMLRLPTWAGLALLLGLLVRESGRLKLRAREAAVLALAAICTLAPIGAQVYGERAGRSLGVDFRAYYCAALAQRRGSTPYYARSLEDCEHGTPAPYYRPPANVTVPAPYPPYALAFFYPLTFLPFGDAMFAWWLVLAASVAAAAWALARIAKQPLLVAWAALALSLGLTSFPDGNVMPVGVAAIVVAALCVARNRPALAAPAIAVAMVEPQIALPAAVALFVAFPAARLALGAAVVALGGLSLLAGGYAQNLAYFTTVLPAHALSEISRDNQYSLSTVIAAVGVPDASAALAGSVSYLLMGALGIVVGLRLARRYGAPALALLVPPAFTLLGGSFVHTEAIATAVPASLMLFTLAQAHRGWIFAALLLLAVPWMMATSAALFLAPLFPVAYLVYVLWGGERKFALGAALLSFAVIFGLFSLAAATPPHPSPATHAFAPIDPRLAEAGWRQFVLGNSTNRLAMWLLRLPTWIGLIAFVAGALALARKAAGPLAAKEYRLTESRA